MILDSLGQTDAAQAAQILEADIKKLQTTVEDGTFAVNITGLASEIPVAKNQTLAYAYAAPEGSHQS